MSKNTAVKTTGGDRTQIVRVMNPILNHRIERTDKGFALYDGYGYSGTFASESEAMRIYSAPATNYDYNSTPDGV